MARATSKENEDGRSPTGRAGRASPEPSSTGSLGHSATIPNAGGCPCGMRLKLDRRIRNQRASLRDNWMIVEQRSSWLKGFPLRSGLLDYSLKIQRDKRRYAAALERIAAFGHGDGHGRGYTCATIAKEALESSNG